jgi:hypothetical protein
MFKQVNRLSLIAGDLRGARVLGSLFNVHVEERIFFDEIDCLRVAHDSPGPSALGKWDHRKSLCLGVHMGGAGRPSMLWLPSQLRPGVSAFHNPRTQRPLDLSQESVPIAFVSADVSIATLGSEAAAVSAGGAVAASAGAVTAASVGGIAAASSGTLAASAGGLTVRSPGVSAAYEAETSTRRIPPA